IHDFYNGAWSPVNPKASTWTNSYKAIQVCNFFLEEYLGLTFDELSENDDYLPKMFRYHNCEHEARFLRAYFYFNLVRQYGDVPFYTSAIKLEEVNQLSRTPFHTIIDFIVKECDDLATLLPADYSDLGNLALPDVQDNGRVTRLAALALKARALLYAASPLFNTTDDNSRWVEAAKANKAVLDSCAKYNITLSTYTDIWGANNWTSTEAIFVRRISASYSDVEGYNFPIGIEGGNSGNCPTQTLVDAYQMQATGLFWDEPGSGYVATDPFAGRDPRFAMTVKRNGDTGWPSYNSSPLQTYFGGTNGEPISGATPTGYYLGKLLDASVSLRASTITRSRHSWITYRLGEFYLNYAEAVFRALGSADATSADFPMSARDAVNVIRTRPDVNMPPLAAGLSNTEFWKQYTNERMVELAFEGHRFWDVRRWKEGEKFAKITRLKITLNNDGTFTYAREVQDRTWEDKMYLFPIPRTEILKNPNLTQNQGW
ncbi:MAG: RagB/SusD family nutrient uptake outer membrane protein, partial [Alistipes sp.]|nr:RagB/SusD family nutrient uptake outer membrane protein [Alistipes sp.]